MLMGSMIDGSDSRGQAKQWIRPSIESLNGVPIWDAPPRQVTSLLTMPRSWIAWLESPEVGVYVRGDRDAAGAACDVAF